jgi:hypothetical protein
MPANIKYLLAIGLVLLATRGYAAPSISGTSGTFTSGQAVTISGSAFGSGATSLEFVSSSDIDSQTQGATFAKTRWDATYGTGDNVQMIVTTDQARRGAGTKVLHNKNTLHGSGSPNAAIYYNFPSPITNGTTLFISWWQRTTWTGTGQYKILRLETSPTVLDAAGQFQYFFHQNGAGFFGLEENSADWGSLNPATPQATWMRMDLYIPVSNTGVRPVTTKYIPGSSVASATPSGTIPTHSSEDWTYAFWQNYFGTDGNGDMTAGEVWQDAYYIQVGNQARVELCDSATWSGRQQCEIQPYSSFADTSISTTFNAGSFTSGTKYLYVVDSTGTVNSSGFAVTLGSGSSDTPVSISGYGGSGGGGVLTVAGNTTIPNLTKSVNIVF